MRRCELRESSASRTIGVGSEHMIHIRIDDSDLNSKRRFACGIGPELPEGDVYFFAAESASARADCPGCNPGGPGQPGTPFSEMTSERFVEIARSWGYD